MCGIAGLYSVKIGQNQTRNHVKFMTDAMVHRGPDAGGVWTDDNINIALGHRRLSIMDLSPAGAQPMLSPSGRYVMTYNGEIFNAPALRNAVLKRNKDTTFSGHSDTEILLAHIDEFGLEATLKAAHGMFAIGLWDKAEKTLHLARDRFGKKPLYLGWAGDDFAFASELKSFKRHPNFTRDINPHVRAQYLQYGYINAPHCIYKDVWMMPPAHYISLDITTLKRHTNIPNDIGFTRYYDPIELAINGQKNTHTLEPNPAAAILDDVLRQSVSNRMASDVPLGAFLSGGIDSALITAMAQDQARAPIDTFTIGFDVAAYSESAHANTIASHLGTNHHNLNVTARDAIDIIPHLTSMYDEPFSDMSAIPTAILSHFTRKTVTVALSGDGGDELFGGYTRHRALVRIWGGIKHMPQPLRRIMTRIIDGVPTNILTKLRPDNPNFITHITKLARVLPAATARELYDLSLMRMPNAPLNIGAARDDLTQDTLSAPPSPYHAAAWHNAFDNDMPLSAQIMLADTAGYMSDNVLTKVDRASMAHSLEVRTPYLDPRVFDCAWGLAMIA